MMTFAGIVFDFNGVLLWDSHLHEQAWQETARAIWGRPFTPDEIAHQVHGRNNRRIVAYLLGTAEDDPRIGPLAAAKEQRYQALCLALGDRFQLSPGAVELLDYLARRQIPRTIATASDAANVAFFVEHLGLARWFDPAKIVCDDGHRHGKPAPDFYQDGAAELALPPAACVVVEDSLSGLAAAAAAGCGYLIALGPPSRHAELAGQPGVRLVVEQLGEVPLTLFG